jgi:hypothetical protein
MRNAEMYVACVGRTRPLAACRAGQEKEKPRRAPQLFLEHLNGADQKGLKLPHTV